ncbi:MAG: FmdB family zinc ribbon protein [Bacteroidota bacterium]
MPTYEYKREDGTVFEFTQKMSDAPLTTCPTTGQAVKRVISGGSGVVYKGEGWYVTDYKNSDRKNGAQKESKDSTSTSETKPDSPTSGKPDKS